jgi:hypothetical protein
MAVEIIRGLEAILAAPHVWSTSVVTDIRRCFAIFRRKFPKYSKAFVIISSAICAHVYKGLRYLYHAYLCACLQRPSLSSSCLSVRMSTKAFVSSSCISVRMSTKAFVISSMHIFIKVDLEQWHLENGSLKVYFRENSFY